MIFYWYLRTLFTSQTRQFQRSNSMESTAWPSPLISNCQPRLVLWLMYQPKSILKHLKSKGEWIHIVHSMDQCTRQACSSHNSTWLWDECGDPLRAGAGKITASKYIFEVTNFLENSCQPSCICVNQSVIFVFTQTSLKPPQKHWWSSLTISDCSFRWNWKYFLRIWWSDLSFSQFCIYFPGDFIRFAGRELLVSEMIFLMFFPPTSCSKTNRNFNRHLFLPKNWNNHAPPSLVPQPTCYWNSFLLICISDTLWFGVN